MNAPQSAATSQRQENWLPVLQIASQEVFELMLGSRLEIPSNAPAEENLDLTSMVGLAGQLSAVLTVRCSSKSAALMACRMLGVDADAAGRVMFDAAGEVCNMVAGNFKNKISGLGDGCLLSVPTVITGEDYGLHLHPQASDKVLRTTMLFEGEPGVVSLEIHN